MKNKFYFFLAALCCAVMSLMPQRAMANPTVTEKGIQYELIDNTSNLKICNCDPSVRGDVDLPAYVELLKKRPVVKITSWAFSPLDLETNLTTPYTITEIEKQAFSGAKGLKAITLNMGITEIGERAFDGCEKLSKINFPTTITAIKKYTFNKCTSLKEIYIPKNILYINAGAFNECKKLETVQGMAGVTSIGFMAFYQCSNLKSVDLSSATSLNSIGEDAFGVCGQLKKITLPPSLTEIGEHAFSFSGLDTVINLSTTPQKIYANVFHGNVLKFNTLIVPKGCREKYQNANVWKDFGTIIELGEQGAPDPYSSVPSGKHKIGDLYYSLSTNQEAMVVADASYATGLNGSLRVPSSVTYNGYIYTVTGVDKQAFKQCTLLTDVYLPNTITHIGDEAFSGCSKLFGGTLLPSNVTSLGKGVFEGCVALSGSIAMPEAITVVPDNCFKECEKLYNVKLSPVTTEIGNRAFYGCYALHTVTFPPSLSSIQYYSFSGCKNIESIICECTTPPSYILNYSFYATNLPDNCIVYVPKGHLTDYKEDANWKYWQKLREIGSNERLKYGDVYYQLKEDGTAYATYEVKNSEDNYKSLSGEVTVADFVPYQGMDYKVISIGSGAFKNSKGMTKVNLPEHLEEISGEAFMNCTALEDANIPANVVWLNNSAFEGSALFNNNKDKDGAVYYDNCLLYYTLNSVSGTYTVKKGTRMIATRVFEGDEKITELIVPEGVRRVLTNSIESMYALQTLRLPSTLEFIGVNFCNDCFYLTKIYNFRKKPFDLSENNCFDNVNQAKCTLYVPYGSSNEYNKAVEWKDFTVVEMGQSFTVTFEDWNGYVLKTETVLEGEDANKPAEDPSREGYNFIGWSPSYENVKSNLTITAQYEPKKFTVRFYDEDKTTLLKEEEVEYGLSAIAPEPPTHEGFDFFAWDNYFDVVTSDMDIYAVYTKSQYWIYFEDGDGNVFYSIQREHGETMSVLVPSGDEDALKKDCHSFTGKWLSSATGTLMTSKEVADAIITGEVTYTAQFELNYYYVKSNVSHGTVKILEDGIDMDHVACGTVLHIEPVPDEGYEFDGWVFEYDPEAGITITEDFWFSGNCKVKKCTVQFIDWNDTELKKETVEYGKSATAPADPVREGYTFIGWDKDYKNVTGDMTVKAQYTINQYTVIFQDWDHTELSKQVVEYGNSAIAPDDPTREGYTFTGWDKAFDAVTEDMTVTAQYEVTTVYFTVTYYDWDLTILGTEQVEEGHDAQGLNPEPTREGYTFTGWSKPLTNITSDLSVQAQYKENVEVDYTPQNLKAALLEQNNDVMITLSWDKVDGAASYELRVAIGENELFSQNTMTLNVISSLLSTIEKEYQLTPGTFTIDWFVRSTDGEGSAISDWAQGESFEVTIKDTGTGLDEVNSQKPNANSQKILIDGVLYIQRNGHLFDAQGQMVK